jgi:hypothetical protein
MNNEGAREIPGGTREGPDPDQKRPDGAPAPTHDLLVMSLGPEVGLDVRSNHACLNSLRSSSWIIPSGGCPKTMAGL